MKKTVIAFWFTGVVSLFLYSFTQVDLNLTLSKVPLISTTIKSFQYIGYFQRPLSLYFYVGIISLLFISYLGLLYLVRKNMIRERNFWTIFIVTVVILIFSYPAFSYDIYNYMFDAKTILIYQKSPWHFRPLDFTGDPWLAFMHWTHRPSVYPPFWILLSLPFYLIGLNFFITTLISFKVLMAVSFIASVWLVGKLSFAGEKLRNMAVFAFNPLMLIENTVSAHNDIVMMFFALLGVYFFIGRKKLISLSAILLSVLIKYATVILLPLMAFALWKKTKKENFLRLCFIAVLLFFSFWITRVEIQPWYLVWLFPFAVLCSWKKLKIMIVMFSAGLLLRYAPFLYLGNWDGQVMQYKQVLTILPAVSLLIVYGIYKWYRNKFFL